MISVEDAKNIILESTNKLKSENVDLIDSLDRISYENILTNINLPRWDNSSMDGYALILDESNESSVKNKLDGDAIVTKCKNIGIGILTADCAPILLYDPRKKIIGCIHSGWKGALNGVIKNTIKKFNELNCNINDLIVVVGPCIKKENYEVKNDFYKKFVEQNPKYSEFFEKIMDYKYTFDLRGFINKEIYNLNVKNVENIKMDTFSESNFFYSYRRSRISKEKDYGRCISVILMT